MNIIIYFYLHCMIFEIIYLGMEYNYIYSQKVPILQFKTNSCGITV